MSEASKPEKAWTRALGNLPLLRGLLPIKPALISTDVIAGTTLAALAIPEVMGYTSIAGMPIITGLYTLLLPLIAFSVLGSSRHLVVGADSATAAILFGGLTVLATPQSPQWVALAGMCAIITGVIVIIAQLARLAFLADFLSRSVLIGFLTGVGIQVACGQVGGMLGVTPTGSGTLEKLSSSLRQISEANRDTVLVSVGVLVVILGSRHFNRKIPGALIAVIGAILLSSHVNLTGVVLVGHVANGLPSLGLPSASGINWKHDTPLLLTTCFSMFVVILAQSAATSRAYATKHNEKFDENLDLVGLGIGNVAAGISGTFVVNGSPTKTQMVDGAGGKSQMAQLSACVCVIIVLLFLTGPLAKMPVAVLDAVVFLIGIELIDIVGMRGILKVRRGEFVIAAITAAIVVLVGVKEAILLAIAMSLIDHVRRGYRPKNLLLDYSPPTTFHWNPVSQHTQARPGLVVYRFNHSIYYANAQMLSDQVLEIVNHPSEIAVRWLCIDASSVDDIDYSAGRALVQLVGELKDRSVRLCFAALAPNVIPALDKSGVSQAIGADGFYESLSTLLEDYANKMLQPGTTVVGEAAGGTE